MTCKEQDGDVPPRAETQPSPVLGGVLVLAIATVLLLYVTCTRFLKPKRIGVYQ
jgi:hypothetical protein